MTTKLTTSPKQPRIAQLKDTYFYVLESISIFKHICHLKFNYFHPIIFTLCVKNI
jgi:hypothetical protein